MQRTKSKLLSILLSLVMLLSLLPTTALAAGNYPEHVRLYNKNGISTSLSDGECLVTNDGKATSYSGGAYVARYDSGTLYLNGYHGVVTDGKIFADGDLNIEVVSDSSFSTSVSATNDLYGIQANGKLNISGSGKLTVTANGNGNVYGIYANEGVTTSAPLDVRVGKVGSSKNGPVHGIYAQSGTISLSGNDMTVTATGGNEAAYGVYNQAKTSSSNITISGKLTVNLNEGYANVGIYSGSGGTITLDGATVIIPKNFDPGIFNNNGNVIIKNNSNVTLTSDVSGSWGVYAKYGGDLIIENSTVKVSADSLAACLERGNVSIKDSKVELKSTYNHYEVIRTGNSSLENTIDLSGSDSVTLTASGEQTSAMITGGVTLVGSTKCVKGTEYDYGSYKNYDGEYDKANNITVLKFVHKDPAPTTNISVSGTVKSYNPGNATTIQLKQGDTVKYTATIEPTTDSGQAEQNFSFDAVAPGTYDLVVTKPGHLSYTVKGVVVGDTDLDLTKHSNAAISTITLLCGDIDGNGFINSTDLGIILKGQNYGKSTATAGDKAADLDGNGFINSTDLGIVLQGQHYGKSAVSVNFGE